MRTTTIKHIVTLPLIVLGMGIFTSCEDFLSEKKYDFIDEADFYTNNTELELAVNGAYEVLSEKMTYGHFMLVNDCDTDLSHIKGSGTGQAARDIGHYNIYAAHTWLEESWGLYYTGIDRVNRIMDNKEKVELPETGLGVVEIMEHVAGGLVDRHRAGIGARKPRAAWTTSRCARSMIACLTFAISSSASPT